MNSYPVEFCARDNHVIHGPVLCDLLPELVFAPRLILAKTAPQLYLNDDNPPIRRQHQIGFGQTILLGASRPEYHFHVFPIHAIQFKAVYASVYIFHAFQEITEVWLPRQVIEDAEEVASQDVLAILPTARLGQVQLRVELSLEHDTLSIVRVQTGPIIPFRDVGSPKNLENTL